MSESEIKRSILTCPKYAIYIWYDWDTELLENISKELKRYDIVFVGKSWLDSQMFRGCEFSNPIYTPPLVEEDMTYAEKMDLEDAKSSVIYHSCEPSEDIRFSLLEKFKNYLGRWI